MSNPWIKFYPRDWRGDQALRAVSIGARGLWMECLCIMHEAKPYGHLLLNGNPVENDVLSRMVGASVDEVSGYLTELQQAGVLSVTGKGVVFSRRMTKDHARAQKGQKSAKKRWSQDIDIKEEKEPPNGSPNRTPITQKPEARSQKEKKETKVSQKRLKEGEAELRVILDAEIARAVVDHRTKIKKPLTPRAATLLANQFAKSADPNAAADTMIERGWHSFNPEWAGAIAPPSTSVSEQPQFTLDQWRQYLDRYNKTGFWHRSYGPQPSEPGCLVPLELFKQKEAAE